MRFIRGVQRIAGCSEYTAHACRWHRRCVRGNGYNGMHCASVPYTYRQLPEATQPRQLIMSLLKDTER